MTGPTHRLIAGCGAMLAGASPAEALASALGGTLPDTVEVPGAKHRGVSHWPLPWGVLTLWLFHHGEPVASLAGWFALGALFHIGADLFTLGGVPLIVPWRRVRLGRLRTGRWGERVVSAAAVGVIGARLAAAVGPLAWPP